MKKDRYTIFNVILILLPIIDLFSSLTIRFTNSSITLAAITKGLMVIYFAIYIFFLTGSKNKNCARWLTTMILLFCLLYFATKPALLTDNLISECSYLMKIVFFPIIFLGLTCYYSDKGFNKNETNKVLLIDILLYTLFLLIPFLTNTYFHTYKFGGEGSVGWYYSGNEISGMMVLLLPFVYTLIKDKKISFIIFFLIVAFVISMIGTKVAMFGSVIVCVLISFYLLFNYNKIKTKSFLLTIFALLSILLIMYDSPAIRNMSRLVEQPIIEEPIEEISGLELDTFFGKYKEKLIKLLSGRDTYLISIHNIHFQNKNASVILLGLGFSNTPNINNNKITKLIEIDILDIYYHTGILGLFVILIPFIYTFIVLIKSLALKSIKLNTTIIFYGVIILLSLGISCFSGHVLFSPSVSLYIGFYLIFLLNEIHYFDKKPLKEKKIEILSLHLGFGGAERATIDLANMLSEKYEVELISLYKTVDTIPYKVANDVKITYLTETKPNKEELKEALKKANIIKIFKEGFKSIRILYLKYILIKNCIEYSDAKTIISSRIYFTNILNNHGRNEAKKIAIEHNYNIDREYIKKLKRSCTSIDSLVVVSKASYDIYKENLDMNVVYIPNIVTDDYHGLSKLNNKRLIYVGRLEEEKGVMDLVEIMKKIHLSDSSVTLDIYGDGSLKASLESQIKEYKLNENIYIHGFKTPEYLCEAYRNSSLFILVSHKESFGIVLLEAMKCGLPAIAFDEATGAKENIINGKNGYLIKNRNIDEMKKAILKYLSLSKEEKHTIQKNAISYAEEFTEKNVKKIWFDLLKSIEKE